MKRLITYCILIFLLLSLPMKIMFGENGKVEDLAGSTPEKIYDKLNLEGRLDFDIFQTAIEGMKEFEFNKSSILTIIDYTKASHEKRLFVIDLKNDCILYNTLVAHGKNSGIHYAEKFSNINQSLMSSPGFFSTAETYIGKHGYSLKLDGLEKGVNDKARERLIVIHGANYVSENFIAKHGRIGRSWGCPALPPDLSKVVIDMIREGSCLYIHVANESVPN